MKQKKSASILKKFLLFNFAAFSVLGIFTIIYLEAIQPNLVKDRIINHKIIISNTIDHFDRLSIDYTKDDIRTFLLSARFLFQSLDRVQFYDLSGNLIGVNKPTWRIYDYNYNMTVHEERFNVLTFVGGNCGLMYAR